MELWQVLLYGAASALALRCLAALMTAHRQRLEAERAAELEEKRREERMRAKKEKEAQKKAAATGRRPKTVA